MRHRKRTFKLGRRSAHVRALLANQVLSLILHGQIKTTVQKAKGAGRMAEKMVSYAKKGDLHHRRLAVAKIKDKNAVRLLFSDIAPRFADRKGGYTKLLKLGRRIGDSAEMALLRWIDFKAPAKAGKKKPAEKKKADKDTRPQGVLQSAQ